MVREQVEQVGLEVLMREGLEPALPGRRDWPQLPPCLLQAPVQGMALPAQRFAPLLPPGILQEPVHGMALPAWRLGLQLPPGLLQDMVDMIVLPGFKLGPLVVLSVLSLSLQTLSR